MRPLGLLLLLLCHQFTFAQEFLRRAPRVRIGSVLNIRGSAVGVGAADRTLQYLKRGDRILDRQTIFTRKGSQVVLKIGLRSKLTLAPETKISLIFLQGENRYLVRLIQGVIRYQYLVAGVPDVFVSGKSYGTYYTSPDFDAVLKKNRFYFRPTDKKRIVKYQRTGAPKKPFQVTKEKIELLSQGVNDNEPVYFIKGQKKNEAQRNQTPEAKTGQSSALDNSEAISEAEAIFGDSLGGDTLKAANIISKAADIFGDSIGSDAIKTASKITKTANKISKTADTISKVADIFGDSVGGGTSTSAQEELAEMFGEVVDTKSQEEKNKLKDNVGVLLEKIRPRPLPKVGVLGGRPNENPLEELDLSIFLKSTFYASEPQRTAGDVDNQGFHQDIRVNFGNKLKINDVENLTYSGWLEGSNRKNVYNDFGDILDLQSSQRNYAYINEFYYTYSTREFDIQFGKKIIKTGKGIIFSPSDSFTPVDATVPTSPLFLGSFVLSVDYYMKDWTLTTMLFPAIVPNKSPTQNSRWTTLYSDIDFQLEQELPSGFSAKSQQIFLRLEGTKWGTDWQFSFFNGPNTNPVIRNDIVVTNNTPSFTLVQEHVPITFFALGFSTTFGGLEFHGEILNQNAEDGKDDSFTALMLGFRYVLDTVPKKFGLNSIDIIMEHARESLRSAQSQPFYALSSIGSRFYQNSWVGTTIFNVTDNFSFNYDFHLDLENKGVAQIFGLNYNAGRGQWRLKQESYDGEDTSNFGQWEDNDNTTLEYIYNW